MSMAIRVSLSDAQSDVRLSQVRLTESYRNPLIISETTSGGLHAFKHEQRSESQAGKLQICGLVWFNESFVGHSITGSKSVQPVGSFSSRLSIFLQMVINRSFRWLLHVAGGTQGFLVVTTRGTDLKSSGLLESSEVEFLESIKKGSTADATLLIHKQSAKKRLGYSSDLLRCNSLRATSTSCRISSPALVPISSTRASASRAEKRCDSALPSSWRRAISPCMAVTMKPAVDSPSLFTTSIASIIECGTRTVVSCDFAFLLGVAITETPLIRCVSIYTKNEYIKTLMCVSILSIVKHTLYTGKAQEVPKIAKPGSAPTLTGPLTTTDNLDIEVAEMNITTHPQGRNTHTRGSEAHLQSFIWIIAAVRRDCQTINPVLHHIAAESEREARRALARDHVCFFAGRLPVHGHGDMTTPSNHGDMTTVQEVRHA